jgi:hypothetical protein
LASRFIASGNFVTRITPEGYESRQLAAPPAVPERASAAKAMFAKRQD